MTTLTNGENNKVIQYSISNVIHETVHNSCIIEMPTIICSNKKDAERIQSEVGAFVGKLSRTIIEDKI